MRMRVESTCDMRAWPRGRVCGQGSDFRLLWSSTNLVTANPVPKSTKMKKNLLLLCLLAVACANVGAQELENITDLHVAFITSFEGDYDSSVAVPAARLAADKINEDENLLPGYRLVVELVESRAVAEEYANSKVHTAACFG